MLDLFVSLAWYFKAWYCMYILNLRIVGLDEYVGNITQNGCLVRGKDPGDAFSTYKVAFELFCE